MKKNKDRLCLIWPDSDGIFLVSRPIRPINFGSVARFPVKFLLVDLRIPMFSANSMIEMTFLLTCLKIIYRNKENNWYHACFSLVSSLSSAHFQLLKAILWPVQVTTLW